jgi:hypothetical protein
MPRSRCVAVYMLTRCTGLMLSPEKHFNDLMPLYALKLNHLCRSARMTVARSASKQPEAAWGFRLPRLVQDTHEQHDMPDTWLWCCPQFNG